MSTTGKLVPVTSGGLWWKDVLALDEGDFPRPWKPADWESLDLAHHGLWAWIAQDRPVGFALFSLPQDETAHLLKILLIPEMRGGGASRIFWSELQSALKIRGYRSVYLEVEESNARAQSYYKKLGFQILRRVKSYYSDGEGAVMMQLTI